MIRGQKCYTQIKFISKGTTMIIIEFFLKDYRYDPLQNETVNCPECKHQHIIQMKRYDDEIQVECPECRNNYCHYKLYY